MADLEFTGDLDISEALQSVDNLGDALQSRIDEALGNVNVESFIDTLSAAATDALSTPIPVEADASAIAPEVASAIADGGAEPITVEADASAIAPEVEAAIADAGAGAQVDIGVTADTAPAEGAIDDLVSEINAQQPEITVAVDTGDADAALAGLSASGDEATESLSATSAASTGLSGAASLASGSLDSLAGTGATLATGFGGAGTAIGITLGTLGAFTLSAVNSQGATFRLDAAMGGLASRVNTIRVGSLNTELGDLAIKTGSSASEMRGAAVDAFLMQESFGRTREESADFAANILALSSRAVALDPSLGSAGAAAGTLTSALASGRDKGLIPFNLGLTGVEIKTRAAAIALADGRDETTAADRAYAGAALAVERLGGHLKRDIEEGSKNPIIQTRALAREFSSMTTEIGRPLIVPAIDTLRELKPVVGDVLEPLGDLAGTVLPAVASGLGLIGPALGPGVIGFIAWKAATTLLPFTLNLLTGSLLTVAQSSVVAGTAVGVAATQAATASAVISSAVPVIGLIAGALAIGATAFGLFGGGAERGTQEVKDFGSAVEAANGALDESAIKATRSLLEERNQVDDLGAANVSLAQFVGVAVGAKEKQRGVLSELKSATDQLMVAERDEGTAIQGSTAKVAAARAERDRLLGVLRQQDPELGKVVAALLREDSANSGVIATLLDLSNEHANVTGKLRERSKAQGADAELSGVAAEANRGLADSTNAAAVAAQAAADGEAARAAEMGEGVAAFDAALDASVRYAFGIGTAADLTDALAKADQELRGELDLLFGRFLSADQATNNYKLGLIDLNEQLFASGFALDDNSKAGLENQNALDGLAEKAINASSAILAQSGSLEQAKQPLIDFRGSLITLRDNLAAAGKDTSFVDGMLANVDSAIAGVGAKAPEMETEGKAVGDAGARGVEGTAGFWTTAGGKVAAAALGAITAKVPDANRGGGALSQGGASGVTSGLGAWTASGSAVGGGAASGMGSTTGLAAFAGAVVSGAGAGGAASGRGGWVSAGVSVASGLAEGIAAGKSSVVNAAVGLANTTLAAARLAFGITSPSKVMALQVGLPMAQGWAMGITAGTDIVQASITQLGNDAMFSARGTFDQRQVKVYTPIANDPFGLTRYAASGKNAGGGPMNLAVNVHVNGVSDPAQARRAGQEAAAGLADGLVRRRLVVAARTGGG